MLRRSHRKTKKGSKCEECRRRHIRCDQQRPSCINCQSSERVCTYRSTAQSQAVETSSAPVPSSNNRTPSVPSPQQHGEATQGSPSQLGLTQSHGSLARSLDDPLVNVFHLELFNHFIQGTFLFIDRDTSFTDQLKRTVLSSAFSTPYLMHGILAFSARHLSTKVSAERSHYYLDQSTTLQTWAVTKFNPAPPEPDQDICVALLLFSSLLSVQGLADLAPLVHLPPEPFFIRFGHYFGLHRGVTTIIGDHWPRLRESELRDLVEWCQLSALTKGLGSECDGVRKLVAQSTDISPSAAEAYRHAIEQIQCILDGHRIGQPLPVYHVYLTLAWPLLVHEKLVDLLVLRRPVAMIILAYYGVALDLCQDLWMVGHIGKRLVRAIAEHLGPDWAEYLQWPCDVVGISSQ
ncbi:hypothetical protein F5B22DRAFT_620060 [Xylaria bambusicola]|uniref:uncharacterized protein n=1 Tax=Xylaria bambusicola TaxID=326684 RepID=UPI0020081DAC|nr:uncharacterized protein F5B22DRAFT_620060 [Xylaria bambusicola]KAI0508708.1 hypothetical protein F5B22DRAFT_620060 [Xylaria bambusicola]